MFVVDNVGGATDEGCIGRVRTCAMVGRGFVYGMNC